VVLCPLTIVIFIFPLLWKKNQQLGKFFISFVAQLEMSPNNQCTPHHHKNNSSQSMHIIVKFLFSWHWQNSGSWGKSTTCPTKKLQTLQVRPKQQKCITTRPNVHLVAM